MRKFATMLLVFVGSSILVAQGAPSAFEVKHDLRIGGEISDFNPDYSCVNSNIPFSCSNDLRGIGITADYQVGAKLGAEGEGRWLPWNGAQGQTESSYLIGPTYRLWSRKSISLSAKVLAGIGHISVPQLNSPYFAYAPGADLSYHYSRRVSIFLDYEYQQWPSFAGPPTFSNSGQLILHNHGLSPNGFSIGAKYRIF